MRLRSIVFRRASLVIALLLSIALTACGGSSGSSPSNSSSNNTSPTQPPKQETSTDDDKTSESTEHWLFTQASNQPTVFSTANGVVVEQLYSVTNLSDNDMSLDGVLLYNVANAKASQYGNDYDKIFKDPSLISQTITARASSGSAPCIAVFDRNVSSNVIPTKSSVTICIDTLVSKGGFSISHLYKTTPMGTVNYQENDSAPIGKIGDTLLLKIKNNHVSCSLNSAIYKPAESSFICSMAFATTTTSNLIVSPYSFQINVYDRDHNLKKTYRSDAAGQNLSLSNPGYVDKTTVQTTDLFCRGIDALSEGDIVNVMYWPHFPASEGMLSPTNCYATWTMTYRNGSLQ